MTSDDKDNAISGDSEFSFIDEYKNWSKNSLELKNLLEKKSDFYRKIENEIENAASVVGKDITKKIKPILNKIKTKFNFDPDIFKFLVNSGFDKSGLCKYLVDEWEIGSGYGGGPFKFCFYKSNEDNVAVSYEEQSTTHFGKYGLINIPNQVFNSFLSDDEIADTLCNLINEAIRSAALKLHSCMKD